MKHIELKRSFIQWFMSNHQPKQPEVSFLLDYMLRHDDLLQNVHFVENTENCPRTLIFAERFSEGIAFQYKVPTDTLLRPEQAMRDIKENHGTPLYIHVLLDDTLTHLPYLNALEDNPFREATEPFAPLTSDDIREVDALLEHVLLRASLDRLNREIDIALDTMDRERFLELSERYNSLTTHSPQHA